MSAAFTPGPWHVFASGHAAKAHNAVEVNDADGLTVAWAQKFVKEYEAHSEANARLIAAAPELYDGCNAVLGLVQLLLGRDDLSAELREVLTTNHRIAEAEAATAKARGEAA